MNFVVVDNNKSDLDLVAAVIATAMPECQIQLFADPLLSAKYICNNPVDMVFLADSMRSVNDFRLLQVLRKNVPKLVIIMLSDSDRNRIDAIHAEAAEYLLKLVTVDLLMGVVNSMHFDDGTVLIKAKKALARRWLEPCG